MKIVLKNFQKHFFLIIILSLILSTDKGINAQPKFTLMITGGYSIPLQDFRTEISGLDTSKEVYPYQLKQGFNFGGLGKLAIGKKGNIRVTLGLNYSSFSNSADLRNIYDSAGLSSVTFRPHVNILTVSLGGEFSFLPKGKINPFIGAELTANFWGGSFKFDNSYDTGAYSPIDMKSETRLGLQIGGGIDFMLSKQTGAVIGVKYNMSNLIGKGYNNPSEVAPNEVDLNDKATNGSPAKNISYLQIYAGFSFYFGYPPKTSKSNK